MNRCLRCELLSEADALAAAQLAAGTLNERFRLEGIEMEALQAAAAAPACPVCRDLPLEGSEFLAPESFRG